MGEKICCLIFISLFCFGSPRASLAKQSLVIAGTGDSQKLFREIANAFEKTNSGTKIVVPDSIGSGCGIRSAAQGKCDLGRVARPLKGKEKNISLIINYLLTLPLSLL